MEHTHNAKVIVLIPAYKPDDRLIELTRELRGQGLEVMLVDDGGQQTYAPIFESCRALGAQVAVHAVNMGKGRALKTGINAAMLAWPDLTGIVTADADGQHTPADILRLIEAMGEHPDTLILGSREFTGGNVPFKSRWGNRITRFVYALARLVSSQVNYHLNKHTVFSGRGGKHSMVKYYALAVAQGALGAALVQVLPGILPISAAIIKIPVDLVLFALSYFIQRDYVFDK